MKYTIFPFTDTSDNEKDAELFVFMVGNVGAIWVKQAEVREAQKLQLIQRSSLYYNSQH